MNASRIKDAIITSGALGALASFIYAYRDVLRGDIHGAAIAECIGVGSLAVAIAIAESEKSRLKKQKRE